VGGGMIKIVNNTVRKLCSSWAIPPTRCTHRQLYRRHGTIEGAPGIKPEHLPSSIARSSRQGTRSIQYMGTSR